MKKIILLAALITSLSSCQKLLLGTPQKNTPSNNFEELYKGYNQWYGMFDVRHINWDSLHTIYSKQVSENMSNTELYHVLSKLITPLNDIHAFLQPTSDGLPRFESSSFYRTNKVQQDFSIAVIKDKYLPSLIAVDEHLHYGILNGNIGYIHFGEFGMPLSFYKQQMNTIMGVLKNTKGIIVDVRNHAGGDDQVSRYIAGWFAAEKKLFMTVKKRNGPAHTNFTPPEHWYTDPQGDYQYTRPTLVLTSRWTASAGKTFTWAMNTQTHVRQMGDTTAGGFSDVISRELPNGWLYFVGVGDYRNANGISDEGVGIAPDIRAINTKSDIDAGNDKVLEAAVSKL